MVVEQIDNQANKHMHYGDKPPIGIVNAPDKLPKKVLYSNAEANKIYNQMQHDIYEKQKHTKAPKKGKFPMILKIILGIIGIGAAIRFRKNIGNRIKKIFKG